jgi:pyruvate, water dikinase
MRSSALLPALCLLLAAPALAQETPFVGEFQVSGRYQPLLTRTTARVRVTREAQRLVVSRTGVIGTKSFTWVSDEARVQAGRLTARFVVGGGLAGHVPGGQEPNTFEASWSLSADGQRITERLRNVTRRPPEERWTTLYCTGRRVAATPAGLDPAFGALVAADMAAFDALARRDDVPGAIGVREVKLLATGVDGASPTLYLVNTKRVSYHHDFATRGLKLTLSLEQFNAQTYFTDVRKNIAGTVIYHESYVWPDGRRGLFALEFWPTDPVKAQHVAIAFQGLLRALPFAQDRIAYHPAGETQEALARQEADQLRQRGVRVVTTAELFGAMSYTPLNLGEGYGVLRVVDPAQPGGRPPSVRDVVIFKRLPNDLSHTSGIITEEPQTPLSHVNLKAKQNRTPNAYVKGASTHARIAPLLGKVVHYRVGPDDFALREATQAEADAFLEALRPATPTSPPRDLSVRRVRTLDEIGHASTPANGAKAANVAELRRLFPTGGVVPEGFAIPFWFYDRFMTSNGLYDEARTMMAAPAFKADPAAREAALTAFRRRIRRADVPADVAAALRDLQAKFPAGTPIRCRSSTNNEDLPGFNGAGLYDSYTHRPNEGDLAGTVKQVWASLWNFRAFEERDFHRIDHFGAAMGVLVHRNYDDEACNGVAITKNPFDPNWPGLYVNAQVGESLITNPDGSTPDEFLISKIGPNGEWETQFIRRSNQVPAGRTVLTVAQTRELARALERIQAHFKTVYQAQNDPKFAMDVEWKFDAQGKLAIKQARPVVND